MKRSVPVSLALVLVAACTDEPTNGPNDGQNGDRPTASATAAPTTSASAATTSNGARSVAEETDDFVFEYSYPAEAGSIPALARLLDSRLDRERTALARQSTSARQDARDNGFPYNKYSSGMKWQVVADLPDWLSLSGEVTSYTGGAHGNYGVQSLIWNKVAGSAMDGVELFTSPQALGDALGTRFCDGLDRLRAARRTEPIEGDDNGFNDCPGITDLTVLVGSSNGRTFNRLTLYAGPYVAGPYAEGAYEVDLNVDQAVIAAVKPEYRASFSVRR